MHSSVDNHGRAAYPGAAGALLYALLCVAAMVGCTAKAPSTGASSTTPQRIVSLAPSITETLFALGLGSKIVAVTDYCKYPDSALLLDKVGGYFNPNLEKIISLRPDLVILMREHDKVKQFLAAHGVRFIDIENQSFAGLCSSFVAIGRVCAREVAADSLVAAFRAAAQERDTSGTRPRVLMCIGRDAIGSGAVSSVYAAGRGTFYDELIRAAHGVNAMPDSAATFPQISREGILSLQPDIVIDVGSSMTSMPCEKVSADWKSLPTLPAVKHGRVYCISEDYATIPGPRFILLLADLRRIVSEQPVSTTD